MTQPDETIIPAEDITADVADLDPDGLEGEDVAEDDTEAHEHSHGDEHGDEPDDPEDVA